MIMTECPSCEASYWTNVDGEDGVARYWWERVDCEECKAVFWVEHTRMDGYTFDDAEFRETFLIDEIGRRVITREDTEKGREWVRFDAERRVRWSDVTGMAP